MTGTADAVFRVVEDAGEYYWLKILAGRGEGMQVAVPKWHEAYDDTLRERIEALEPGEVVEAVLQSTNEKNTAWRFDELPGETETDREELHASD